MAQTIRLPSFWLKAAFLAVLVAVADLSMFEQRPGAGMGVFLVSATAALAISTPAILRSRLGAAALLLALFQAAMQIERASVLGMLIFAAAFGVAALSPRAGAAEDAWRWLQRLVAAGAKSVIGPVWDLQRLMKARARRRTLKVTAVLMAAALPVLGGLVFLWLFGLANPVISGALDGLRLPAFDPGRLIFWGAVAGAAWAALRPRGMRRSKSRRSVLDLGLPTISAMSVMVSLVVFNAVFALQNGLDIAFLWTGAALPKGVTFAEYAHRGAYPLIATALLAGLFVLVFLQPGSATAASPLVRGLVVVWIAQNLFLVASTVLRTLDYIDAYSLTRMRIAALLWMGLVATGLALICWRLLKAKSASWLINANAIAAGLVLLACSVVDLGSIAAAWNVRHAREVGGKGVALDLCYMRQLGGAAVVSLAKLEAETPPGEFRTRVGRVRWSLWRQMVDEESDWRSFRFRDRRRYVEIENGPGLPVYSPGADRSFQCDGSLMTPPPTTPPLTPQANPGT